jgi:hypothetical protein
MEHQNLTEENKSFEKKDVHKSMSNFFNITEQVKSGNRGRRHSCLNTNGLDLLSGKKKKRQTIQQIGLNYVDSFFEDIPVIVENFLKKYTFKNKIESFLMNCQIREGMDYLIKTINAFPEFNMFDYLCDTLVPPNNKLDLEKRKQFYIKRNNIFFTILFYCKNLSTAVIIDKQVDYFVKVNLENHVPIDLEVDFFLLTIHGYKDKAKNLIIKQNEYFKSHLKDLNIKETDILIIFNKINIEKDISSQSMDEIILLRKLMVNIILRKFFTGINYLMNFETILILMIEGRIWKIVITELTKDIVLEIWIQYHNGITAFLKKYNYHEDYQDMNIIKKKIYIHTLETQFSAKLVNLKDEEEVLKQKEQEAQELNEFETHARQRDLVSREREEFEREISLPPIVEFVDLLKIIFQYNKKDVALVILDSPLTGIDPTQEIFEICLNYDEDLAM